MSVQPITLTVLSVNDKEIDAIQFVMVALRDLEPETRRRVLRYVMERFAVGREWPSTRSVNTSIEGTGR